MRADLRDDNPPPRTLARRSVTHRLLERLELILGIHDPPFAAAKKPDVCEYEAPARQCTRLGPNVRFLALSNRSVAEDPDVHIVQAAARHGVLRREETDSGRLVGDAAVRENPDVVVGEDPPRDGRVAGHFGMDPRRLALADVPLSGGLGPGIGRAGAESRQADCRRNESSLHLFPPQNRASPLPVPSLHYG